MSSHKLTEDCPAQDLGQADHAKPPVCSWLANPSSTKELLARFGLFTKKRFGQNFLINDHIIQKIIKLARLDEDASVLEVGPGIGTLTCALLERSSRVLAIEADSSLKEALLSHCAISEHFSLIEGDACKVSLDTLRAAQPKFFVANLPYQVAATLILLYLQEIESLSTCVVMVQAEVADRIAAQPGTKAYGAYTAKLALLAELHGRFEVSPNNFMPAPRVNSAVVRLDRRRAEKNRLDKAQIKAVFSFIDAAFAQRRKTLKNSLKAAGYFLPALERSAFDLGISLEMRAEHLTPSDFVRLCRVYTTYAPEAQREPSATATVNRLDVSRISSKQDVARDQHELGGLEESCESEPSRAPRASS